MKQKIFLFVLVLSFVVLSKNLLSHSIQKENYKAYLTISFQSPTTFKDSTVQRKIEANIESIFEKEGIQIVHKEKLEEYKLYINITIGDSIIIEAKGIGAGDGASVIRVKKTRRVFQYKNEEEIYNSIKSYIKEYL